MTHVQDYENLVAYTNITDLAPAAFGTCAEPSNPSMHILTFSEGPSGIFVGRVDELPQARDLRAEWLRPDILFSDCTIAPFRYGHHAGTVFKFPDDARPLSGPELDRV